MFDYRLVFKTMCFMYESEKLKGVCSVMLGNISDGSCPTNDGSPVLLINLMK